MNKAERQAKIKELKEARTAIDEAYKADQTAKREAAKREKTKVEATEETDKKFNVKGTVIVVAVVAVIAGGIVLSRQNNKGTVTLATLKPSATIEVTAPELTASPEATIDKTSAPTAATTASTTAKITAAPLATAEEETLRYNPKDSNEIAKRAAELIKAVATDSKQTKTGKAISTKDAINMITWFTSKEYKSDDEADRAENTLGTVLGIDYFTAARVFNTELKVNLDPADRTETPLYDKIVSKEGEAIYSTVLNMREKLLDAMYKNDKAAIDKYMSSYFELERKIRGNVKIDTTMGPLSIDAIRSTTKGKEILMILDTFKFDLAIIMAYNPDYKIEMDLMPDIDGKKEIVSILDESNSLNTITELLKMNMKKGKNIDCSKLLNVSPKVESNYYDNTRLFLNGGKQYQKNMTYNQKGC